MQRVSDFKHPKLKNTPTKTPRARGVFNVGVFTVVVTPREIFCVFPLAQMSPRQNRIEGTEEQFEVNTEREKSKPVMSQAVFYQKYVADWYDYAFATHKTDEWKQTRALRNFKHYMKRAHPEAEYECDKMMLLTSKSHSRVPRMTRKSSSSDSESSAASDVESTDLADKIATKERELAKLRKTMKAKDVVRELQSKVEELTRKLKETEDAQVKQDEIVKSATERLEESQAKRARIETPAIPDTEMMTIEAILSLHGKKI